MKYDELLKEVSINRFKRILITGAHRSGTTIAAAMVASDLGINFYPEENIKGGNLRLFAEFNSTHDRYVLQAPGLSVNCHVVDVDAVIFVRRNIVDVINSMKKLNNRVIEYELDRIKKMYGSKYADLSLPIAKLRVFEDLQQPKIKNSYFLDYESLNDHRLWVETSQRKDWHIRQLGN